MYISKQCTASSIPSLFADLNAPIKSDLVEILDNLDQRLKALSINRNPRQPDQRNLARKACLLSLGLLS